MATFRDVLRCPAIKLYLCATFCIVSGHFAAFTYIRPFLENVSGLDANTLSAVFLVFGIAGFFGNITGDAAAQRNARVAIARAALGIAAAMLCLAVAGAHQRLTVAALGL